MIDTLFLIQIVACLLIVLGLYAYLTNPFVHFTIIKDPFPDINLAAADIKHRHTLIVRWRRVFKALAYVKAGWHILVRAFSRPHAALGSELQDIIASIHALRFNPERPFLISGDHFSILYPRSLGIFFYTLLDTRVVTTQEDWLNRQLIYVKTLLYALTTFEQTKQLSTTIVPINRRSVVLMNIYAYPSDTLYSLLTAIENCQSDAALRKRYPFASSDRFALATKEVASKILEKFLPTLRHHWQQYSSDVFDPETQLIKKHWRLSSTKDMAQRQSSFYDTVVYWRTWQLAQTLGVAPEDAAGLARLKRHILATFWDTQRLQFFEDLSEASLENGWDSGDWLIAYQTGFLSPSKKADREYLEKAVQTIIANKTDEPFPLKYHDDVRPVLYWPVRFGAPLYGSQVIWSHWGIEFCKLLLHLAQVTKDTTYLERAERHLQSYTQNILATKGYPEVYSPTGKPYTHWAYASVHQTGWVCNYEQAITMLAATKKMLAG